MLSIAAPFNKDAAIPQGDVSVRDIAGLYIYDNTLLGIKLTGAQVKAYLEKSAEYFKPAPAPGTYPAASLTNAVTPTAPNGTPDYNYDVMGGLDQPLTYDIDLAQPVGSRVIGLAYGGVPVDRHPGVRRRDQQLPAVRRRQLPGRRRRPRSSTTGRSRSGSCSSTG